MFRSFCFEVTLLLTIASEFQYIFSLKGIVPLEALVRLEGLEKNVLRE